MERQERCNEPVLHGVKHKAQLVSEGQHADWPVCRRMNETTFMIEV